MFVRTPFRALVFPCNARQKNCWHMTIIMTKATYPSLHWSLSRWSDLDTSATTVYKCDEWWGLTAMLANGYITYDTGNEKGCVKFANIKRILEHVQILKQNVGHHFKSRCMRAISHHHSSPSAWLGPQWPRPHVPHRIVRRSSWLCYAMQSAKIIAFFYYASS